MALARAVANEGMTGGRLLPGGGKALPGTGIGLRGGKPIRGGSVVLGVLVGSTVGAPGVAGLGAAGGVPWAGAGAGPGLVTALAAGDVTTDARDAVTGTGVVGSG